MTAVTVNCVNAARVIFFFFLISGQDCMLTGTRCYYHWKWSLLHCGAVLVKVVLNAVSHSDFKRTVRGEHKQPDCSETGDNLWWHLISLNVAFAFKKKKKASYWLLKLPERCVRQTQRIWEAAQLLRHFKRVAADDKSLKTKTGRCFSPSSALLLYPSVNLLCFWGQKGHNIHHSCVICPKTTMTSQLHV